MYSVKIKNEPLRVVLHNKYFILLFSFMTAGQTLEDTKKKKKKDLLAKHDRFLKKFVEIRYWSYTVMKLTLYSSIQFVTYVILQIVTVIFNMFF